MIREQLDQDERETYDLVKKVIKGVAAGVAGVVALWGSFYTIPADSVGVVQRFGAYHETTRPGIHMKVPFWVDKVTKVPVTKVHREEFGFRTIKAGINSEFLGSENAQGKDLEVLNGEGLMLTADLNMVYLESLVQYIIKDPVAYLFNVRDPVMTLRDCHQSVMKQVVGNQSFDEAISIARIENEGASKEGLQKLLDDFQTGIHIVSVNLQSCNPPKGVRDAFNGVNRAMQKKDQKINEAMKNYNEEIPMAIGKAEETVKTAEGYATKRVNEAMGDANKFDAVYGAYFRAPEVTKQRLLFETMSRVLPTMREKWIVDEKAMNGGFMNLLHMNANKSGGQK